MLDLFHYHDPILNEEIDRLTLYLEEKLFDLQKAIAVYQPSGLVGASGTFDTLTDIFFASQGIEKGKHDWVFDLPTEAFKKIDKQLFTLNKEERLKIPGMIPMRVDMIVVASCLIDYILRFVPVDRIVCSSFALKEGAIAELMGKTSTSTRYNEQAI